MIQTENTNMRVERNEIERKRTSNGLIVEGLKYEDISKWEKDVWCELNSFGHCSQNRLPFFFPSVSQLS